MDFPGFLERSRAKARWHDNRLGIEIDHGCLAHAELGGALRRDGRVAQQDVHLAGAQGVETLARREWNELSLSGVAKNRGGHGAAKIHFEASPFVARVHFREARELAIEPTLEVTALFRHRQGRLGGRGRRGKRQRDDDADARGKNGCEGSHNSASSRSCASAGLGRMCVAPEGYLPVLRRLT